MPRIVRDRSPCEPPATTSATGGDPTGLARDPGQEIGPRAGVEHIGRSDPGAAGLADGPFEVVELLDPVGIGVKGQQGSRPRAPAGRAGRSGRGGDRSRLVSRAVPVAASPKIVSQSRSRSSRPWTLRPAGCAMTSTWGLRMAASTRRVSCSRAGCGRRGGRPRRRRTGRGGRRRSRGWRPSGSRARSRGAGGSPRPASPPGPASVSSGRKRAFSSATTARWIWTLGVRPWAIARGRGVVGQDLVGARGARAASAICSIV